MGQINIILTPQFERDLQTLMNVRGIRTKSDAIRIAVQEIAKRGSVADTAQFGELPGAGLRAPMNAKQKFRSEDELWLETPPSLSPSSVMQPMDHGA
jgi:hypothetical protein